MYFYDIFGHYFLTQSLFIQSPSSVLLHVVPCYIQVVLAFQYSTLFYDVPCKIGIRALAV